MEELQPGTKEGSGSGDISRQKEALRRKALQARAALGPVVREAASPRIAEALGALPAFRNARGVHCFLSLPDEVDTAPIFNACQALGIPTAIPVQGTVTESRLSSGKAVKRLDCVGWSPGMPLSPGPFKVPEPPPEQRRPFPLDEIDLVVVPGLAFDGQGGRLGHGKGYYDEFISRLLKARQAKPKLPPLVLVGVCFAAQVVSRTPCHSWDQPVHLVVTEHGVLGGD